MLVAALALAPAHADDAESETIELSPPEDVGGTALDDLDEEERDELSLPGLPLRGRLAIRPLLDVTLLSADRTWWAVRAGLSIDHRYWFLTNRTVELAGSTELRASFPFGAAYGRRFVLSSTLGPWLGPLGVRVGPVVRSDRVGWRSADVLNPDTLALGGRGDLSVGVGRVRATFGLEVAWLALGDRPPADPERATLPVIGDETAWRLGLGHQGDRWFTALNATWRETAIGSEIDAGLQLGLRLL